MVKYVSKLGRNEKLAISILLGVCLITRLTWMSSSLSEVDAANFYNALIHGYDLEHLRPHPPGYPVYMLLAWYFYVIVREPMTALTLLSALAGSLAIVPFYLLIRQLVAGPYAVAGGVLFIANPLVWAHSEAALSDVPSMALVLLSVCLTIDGRKHNASFLGSFVCMSLAIGMRLSNLPLAILPFIPLIADAIKTRTVNWRVWIPGLALFGMTTAAWFIPMVIFAGGGFEQYFQDMGKQWSTAVQPTSAQVSGWGSVTSTFARIQRFGIGYLFTYPPTGIFTRSLLDLLLITPWVFGFALFVASFRIRDTGLPIIVVWICLLLPQIIVIHFLPRYGLPYWPGFMIACLIGFQHLGHLINGHRLRTEILGILGISSLLILYGIKHQPPVAIFEGTGTEFNVISATTIFVGIVGILICRRLIASDRQGDQSDMPAPRNGRRFTVIIPVALALLALPQLIAGHRYVSEANTSKSPHEQMASQIGERFQSAKAVACWDNQTHSILEVMVPDVSITGYQSSEELINLARSERSALIFTDRCRWFQELTTRFDYEEIGHYEGRNPLWLKAPSIRLYLVEEPWSE